MPRAGVKRVVIESVAFIFKDAIIPPAYIFGRMFFPGVVADASAMENVLEKSGLDWPIVRPPKLTPTPYTGKYRAGWRDICLFSVSAFRMRMWPTS